VPTRADAQRRWFPALVGAIRTAGYDAVGDGGEATYTRLPQAPPAPDRRHFRSADRGWWEIADEVVSVLALGAKGDFDVSTGQGADDTQAFQSATRLDRPVYVPGTARTYRVTDTIALSRDGAYWYGDGYRSRITLVSPPEGAGELLGIHGDAPSTPAGPPQRFVRGVHVAGLHLDTQDSRNNNGIGGSFCRDVLVENMFFSHIGRKAVTFQYHVHDVRCRDLKVFQAASEPGSTQPAISVEGLTAGVDLSYYPGGTDRTEDLHGEDMSNVTFSNVSIEASGYNYVVVSNAHRVGFVDLQLGDATGAGSFLIFIRKVRDSYVRGVRGGNSQRRFIFFDKEVERCTVQDFEFGSTRGSGGDGRAIQCAGSHNRFENGSFRHDNPATLEAVFVAGTDVRSPACGSSSAPRPSWSTPRRRVNG
jgi:hypothetical protein